MKGTSGAAERLGSKKDGGPLVETEHQGSEEEEANPQAEGEPPETWRSDNNLDNLNQDNDTQHLQ
jgi:hypothetical protein